MSSRNIRSNVPITPAILAVSLALAGCGGGGGGSDTTELDPLSRAPNPPPSASPDDPQPSGPPVEPISGTEGSSLYRGSTNAVVLQGPVIGNGSVPNTDIIREIPVEASVLDNGLVLRSLSVVAFETDTFANYLVVVENTSGRFQCGIRASLSEELGHDGSVRETDRDYPVQFDVWGSNGVLPARGLSSLYDDDCVLPGAIVYGYGYAAASDGDDIGSARVEGLEDLRPGRVPFDVGVEAVSYDVTDLGDVGVLIANRSDRRIRLDGVKLVLLDENGEPVGGLGSRGGGGGILEPGEEKTVLVSGNGFTGQVSTVRAVIGYYALD